MSIPRLEIVPCPTEDRLEALGVLYGRVEERWRPGVVADAYEEVLSGEVDLSGLWIARRRGRIVGAFLTLALPGGAAAVWAPEVESGWNRSTIAVELIHAAMQDLKGKGIRLAQALLNPDEESSRASRDLTRGGLPRVTVLTYLERGTADPLPIRSDLPRFDWRPFDASTETEFREVLKRTYEGSLDMPELDDVRSLDDIIASHKALNRFEPSRWRLGRLAAEPRASAVILLAEVPEKPAWEVAYLGLTPEARGRGLGRAALAHARDFAARDVRRLELAVDARNAPADRLYRSAGFTPFDRRAVHLTILR